MTTPMFIGVMLLVMAASLVVGFSAASFVRSPADVIADAQPPTEVPLTVSVTTGALDDGFTVAGRVSLPDRGKVTLGGQIGVESVITKRPIRAGSIVRSGDAVLELSDRPIFLMHGRVPLLRDLSEGAAGPDVARLQRSLKRLGLFSSGVDGIFGSTTSAAIIQLYSRNGYGALTTDPATGLQFESLVVRTGDMRFIPRDTAQIVATRGRVGDVAADNVVTLATRPLVVQVSTPEIDWLLDRPRVRLQISGRERAVKGKVLRVSKPRVGDTGGVEQSIVIGPRSKLPIRLIDRDVDVTFSRKGSGREGLLVPVSAIYSTSDGLDSVHKVVNGQQTVIAVQVLAVGNGSAMVTPVAPAKLSVGDAVVVGSAT